MNQIKPVLTRQQALVLGWIEDYIERHSYAPTIREISQFLVGKVSPNAAVTHLTALKKKGFIAQDRNLSRTIRVLKSAPRDGMTVEIRVTCSRCGCKLVDDRVVLEVRSGHLRQRKPALDLCDDCYAALSAWLKAGGAAKPVKPLPGQRAMFAEDVQEAEELF